MTARIVVAALGPAALAAVTLHGAVFPSASPQEPQRTFRATADVVSVEVSVRRDRRPVVGLTAADFEVQDNGVAQQIDTVSYERLPIDVTVALDVSASVTGPVLEQLRRSVRQLRSDLGPRDRLKLIAFNMRVLRLMDFRASAEANDTALASLPAAGSSAILDTLAVTLGGAPAAGRRHLVMVFTDGKDSSSVTEPDVLFDIARRTTPTVAVVLASATLEQPVSTVGPLPFIAIRDVYDRLAKETGGLVVYTHADDDLSSTFRRVLSEFRASYVLYFAPRGVEPSGVHTLDVRVKQPGVDVRSRRGYVWR
jgi:VWFA-related protein